MPLRARTRRFEPLLILNEYFIKELEKTEYGALIGLFYEPAFL